MIMTTKLLFYNLLEFWDLALAHPSWRLKILEKKIYWRFKILGSSKKRHDTFSRSKLLADSNNVHVLYVWSSNMTAGYKICTLLESASNLLLEKVPSLFLDEPKILNLQNFFFFSKFSIFTSDVPAENLKILISCRTKVLFKILRNF
jgi:hypothetical protein